MASLRATVACNERLVARERAFPGMREGAEIDLGLASYRLGDFARADAAWDRATTEARRFGTGPSAHLADVRSGRIARAAAAYEADIARAGIALQVSERNARGPLLAALSDLTRDDAARARADARLAVKRFPPYKQGLFVLGLAELRLGEPAQAKAAFLADLESDEPEPPETYLTNVGFAAFDAMQLLRGMRSIPIAPHP